MKPLLLISFLFFSNRLFCQDTIFLNQNYDELYNSKNAKYYKIVKYNDKDSARALKSIYFLNGNLHIETHYSDYENRILDGKKKEWNEEGKLIRIINYKLDKKDGELITFWENDTIKRIDNYKEDSLINGKCYNIKGEEIEYFDYFILPQFPGGKGELKNFLSKEIAYPRSAQENEISGRVLVEFNVKLDGSIYNIRIKESVDNDLDNEAIRVVQLMPKWIPGLLDGIPVNTSFTLPIKFTIQ
jgi:TonB family protein